MQATFLDLRLRMPAVLRALERNESVVVYYRGKKRAVLIPVTGNGKRSTRPTRATTHAAFGMWANRTDQNDVANHIRRLRAH